MLILKRIIDVATSVTAVIAGLCIVVMMGHITLDVILRAVLNKPMTGTIIYVANYYMVFLVCLPLAFVERFDGHIAVEVLTDRLPSRVRHHLYGWTFPFTATIFGGVAYATWIEAMSKFNLGTFIIEKNSAITIWYGYFALPVGYSLLSLFLVLKFVGYLGGNPILPKKCKTQMMWRLAMSDPQVGVLLIGLLLVLIALRVPIGAALVAVPFIGIWWLFGWRPAIGALKVIPYNFAANWQLSSVPMFLMMGFLAYHTGITRGLFQAARVWLARLPGGLAIASIFGAAGFASVTGSSVACAAAMGRIAVPEMTRQGYDDRLATGTVAAAGTIGALIPPSILLIIYGIIAQVPISALFVAAVSAGLLTMVSYVLVVFIWASVNPAVAPRVDETYSVQDRLRMLVKVGPVLLLALLVFGGLFAGIFTPTEAGAVGAVLCALIALLNRALTWARFKVSLIESFSTTAAIFVIAIGANLLGRFVTLTGADDYIAQAVIGLSSNIALLMIGIVVLYLILGMFLDPLGAMLLTLPILLPVAREVGFDLLWFGIILAKLLEIGMITPPIGLNVFVIKGVVGESIGIGRIFKGVMYFLLADLVVVTLLMCFPGIVLFLPSLLQ